MDSQRTFRTFIYKIYKYIYTHTHIYIKKYPLVYNSSRKPQNSSLQMEGDMDSKQPICLNCALYIEFYWRSSSMPDLQICQIAAMEDKGQLIKVLGSKWGICCRLENNLSKGERILELTRHRALSVIFMNST